MFVVCAMRAAYQIASHHIAYYLHFFGFRFFFFRCCSFVYFTLNAKKCVRARLMSRLTFVRHCSSSSLSLLAGIVRSPRANNKRTSHFAVPFCWCCGVRAWVRMCLWPFLVRRSKICTEKAQQKRDEKNNNQIFGSEHLYANFFLNTFEWGQSICRIILFRFFFSLSLFCFYFSFCFSLCVFWLSNALSGGACACLGLCLVRTRIVCSILLPSNFHFASRLSRKQ